MYLTFKYNIHNNSSSSSSNSNDKNNADQARAFFLRRNSYFQDNTNIAYYHFYTKINCSTTIRLIFTI